MKAVTGKTILLFLKADIDNYLNTLQTAIAYCENNDYLFAPKKTNAEKYEQSINKIQIVANDIQANRASYTKTWSEERIRLLSEK